ncbi:MAG: PLP-dependent aminotransferase family protein [Advenella sp.]
MSKVNSIVEHMLLAIQNGNLKSGQKLMSIRVAREHFNVSKNTMIDVYDRLVSLGHITARPGSGYYVSTLSKKQNRSSTTHIAEAVDAISLLREQLNQTYRVRVGDGRPPPSWMSQFDFDMRLKIPNDSKYGYGHPMGFEPLREAIAQNLIERSIQASADQVLLTYGANHAMDLVIKQFLSPGDTVLVDSPGYYPLFAKLKLYKIKMIGVRRGGTGPDTEDLEDKARQHRAKLFFTQTLGHNPTGGCATLAAQYQVLKLAEKYDFRVVENDAFADLLPSGMPRMAGLDQLDRVLYIGTFSKTLSASFRVGYVAGRQALIDSLCNIKMLTVVTSSDYLERWLYSLIANGQYLKHLRRLRPMIEQASAQALNNFSSLGFHVPYQSEGTYYMWLELPAHLDDIQVARKAAEEGIFLAPGTVFYPEKKSSQKPALRINVAYANDPDFLAFLRKLRAGAVGNK